MKRLGSTLLLVHVCACDAVTTGSEQSTANSGAVGASEVTPGGTAPGHASGYATNESTPSDASKPSASEPSASDSGPGVPASTLDGGAEVTQGSGSNTSDEGEQLPDVGAGNVETDESNVSQVTDDGSSEGAVDFEGEPAQLSLDDLPSVRQEHGVVALNGELYVLGGFTPDVTASVQAYAPDTNQWRDVPDFPVAFHHPNVAAVEGRVYVAGFLLGASLRDGDGRVFSYAPGEDEWTEHAPMSAGTERGSACVTSLGSKIYVFGGAGSNTVPDASAYDTELDTWEELPFLPELREHCVAAALGNKLYIVSGRANGIGGVLTESYEFDPATKEYRERAPIPTPRGGTAGSVLGGRIFVFGGEGNDETESGVFSQIEAYDPSADTWQVFPEMLLPRHGFGAATLGTRIYLPGGGDTQGFGSVADFTVLYFDPTNG